MSDRTPRDDEELAALVSELESTLAELRGELDEAHASRGRRRPSRRPSRRSERRLPRPPTPGELLRFTNDYTIPTVVATLQATIEALELLRRFLELTAGTDRDGGRGRSSPGERSRLSPVLSGASERAASDVSDALSQLRTALAEADLPADEESRDVIEDARSLSAQIEERLATSRDNVARQRDRERAEDADGAVVIDVTDGEDDSADDGNGNVDVDTDADAGTADDEPDEEQEVDVEAELRSIKRQMGKDDPANGSHAGDESVGDDVDEGDEGDDADDATADGVTDDEDGENGDGPTGGGGSAEGDESAGE